MRALVRSPARAVGFEEAGLELVHGDLQDPPALSRLCQGVDFVIHCAGAVRGNNYQEFARVNVAGTQQVLDAITSQTEPPQLILLSSLAAREPELSWYSRSKREAEQLLEHSSDVDWTIVRPPAVYGPGDKEMKAIFDTMARGFALVPGSPDARNSLVHVDDLVDALLACLEYGAGRQTYTVCDGREGGYDWRELAEVAGSAWQREVRLLPVPRLLLNAVAACNLFFARMTGRAAMLTPAKLRELRHRDWVVDNRQISADTGWNPRIGLGAGLQALGSEKSA